MGNRTTNGAAISNLNMSYEFQTMGNQGTRIFIGLENELSGLQECSLITACYGNKHNMLGTIGVIGPTSMDYRRIIPVVDYTAKIVSQTITSQSYD